MNTAQVTGVAGALGDANAALPARKQVRIGDRVVEVNSVRCSSGGECLRAEILASRGSAGVRLSLQRAETPEALAKLRGEIARVERSTGWRLRVVTGNGPGGVGAAMPAANDLYRYFGAEDRKLVIMTVDEFNGNVLDFYNDQQALSPIVPKSVVQEIRGRYGNKYFVDEEGLEAATVERRIARAVPLVLLNRLVGGAPLLDARDPHPARHAAV